MALYSYTVNHSSGMLIHPLDKFIIPLLLYFINTTFADNSVLICKSFCFRLNSFCYSESIVEYFFRTCYLLKVFVGIGFIYHIPMGYHSFGFPQYIFNMIIDEICNFSWIVFDFLDLWRQISISGPNKYMSFDINIIFFQNLQSIESNFSSFFVFPPLYFQIVFQNSRIKILFKSLVLQTIIHNIPRT